MIVNAVVRIVVASALLAALVPLAVHAQARSYDALLALFKEWRAFEEPPRLNGVPDYSAATNARRLVELRRLQDRLQAIDTTGWSIPERVDHHLVRAEMNGMEYHLRVLQPFARDPAYYASIISAESDTPSKEGPVIHGAIKLYDYPIWPRTLLESVAPLSAPQAADLSSKLRTIPGLLQAARANLSAAAARDLWVGGVRAFDEQAETLAELASRVGGSHAGLSEAIVTARSATEAFASWLKSRDAQEDRTLRDRQRSIHLVPSQRPPRTLSWDEEVTITKRELARAHTSLRLEENRNRALPPLATLIRGRPMTRFRTGPSRGISSGSPINRS